MSTATNANTHKGADPRAGVDVGCAPLIESGKVKVKQGVEVDRLTENGVVFSNGSEQPADLVIWA